MDERSARICLCESRSRPMARIRDDGVLETITATVGALGHGNVHSASHEAHSFLSRSKSRSVVLCIKIF